MVSGENLASFGVDRIEIKLALSVLRVEQDAEDLEEDDGEDALTERGNLPMPENSPYSLIDMSTDDVVAEIEVSEVNAAVQCTNEYTPEPSGHLLGLDFTVDVDSTVREIQPEGALCHQQRVVGTLRGRDRPVDRDPGRADLAQLRQHAGCGEVRPSLGRVHRRGLVVGDVPGRQLQVGENQTRFGVVQRVGYALPLGRYDLSSGSRTMPGWESGPTLVPEVNPEKERAEERRRDATRQQ